MNERREAKIEILSSCRLKKILILLEIRGGGLWRVSLIFITVSYVDCEFL